MSAHTHIHSDPHTHPPLLVLSVLWFLVSYARTTPAGTERNLLMASQLGKTNQKNAALHLIFGVCYRKFSPFSIAAAT